MASHYHVHYHAVNITKSFRALGLNSKVNGLIALATLPHGYMMGVNHWLPVGVHKFRNYLKVPDLMYMEVRGIKRNYISLEVRCTKSEHVVCFHVISILLIIKKKKKRFLKHFHLRPQVEIERILQRYNNNIYYYNNNPHSFSVFKSSFNDSSLCTLRNSESVSDIPLISF